MPILALLTPVEDVMVQEAVDVYRTLLENDPFTLLPNVADDSSPWEIRFAEESHFLNSDLPTFGTDVTLAWQESLSESKDLRSTLLEPPVDIPNYEHDLIQPPRRLPSFGHQASALLLKAFLMRLYIARSRAHRRIDTLWTALQNESQSSSMSFDQKLMDAEVQQLLHEKLIIYRQLERLRLRGEEWKVALRK